MQFVIISIYIVLIIVVSIVSSKRTNTLNDFFLAGRNLGGWMAAFAYGATYFSSVIFIGYAGRLGFTHGVSVSLIGIGNALLGSWLAWKLLARPTRKITHRLKASTMPDFFLKRYQSKPLKILTALLIFIFLVPYCASVYQGLSYLFESVFHIPYIYCMIGIAVITVLYLVVGGYVATTLMDFIQGIIMIVGVLLMIGFVLGSEQVGGLAQGLEKIAQVDPVLVSPFGPSDKIISLLSMVFLTSIGTWGLPQMVHKFYAIKDDKAIKKGTIISSVFALIIAGGTYFIGAFGRLFTDNQIPIDPSTGAANAELIMPTMLMEALPEALLGLIVVLVLAASMSTLASLVLISSSSVAIDLAKGTIKKDMSQKSTLLLMRILCVVFVVVSLIVALDKNNAILTLMSFSWGTLSGSFLAPFLLGVRWKKVTKAGAFTGVITGVVINIGGAIAFGLDTSMAPLLGSISMIVSFILTVVVSLCTKQFKQEDVEKIFSEEPAVQPELEAE